MVVQTLKREWTIKIKSLGRVVNRAIGSKSAEKKVAKRPSSKGFGVDDILKTC